MIARLALVLISLAIVGPARAAAPPVLPTCPVPAGMGSTNGPSDPAYGFEDGCAPAWTLDRFRPAFEPGGKPDPSRFYEGPYVNAAVVSASPATVEYGDGSDQTIQLTFVAQYTFHQPTEPDPEPAFIDYAAMMWWPAGDKVPNINQQYGERIRDSQGNYGPWRRRGSWINPPPFTLTADEECGGTHDGFNIVFEETPTTCSFTLHWNRVVVDDGQYVFPIEYYAIDLAEHKFIGASGVTWVAMSVGTVNALTVSLEPGVTNGSVFSVDVTVTNGGSTPLTDVAFANPSGVVPLAAGTVTALTPPSPRLPSTLQGYESRTMTVTLGAAAEGSVAVKAVVTATGDDEAELTGEAQATIAVDKRRLEPKELERIYADALLDASQTNGALLDNANARLGLITAWATGPSSGDTVPSWLNGSVHETASPPVGTQLTKPADWQVSAARSLGLDDRAFAWLPEDPLLAEKAYLAYADRFALAGGKVVDESVAAGVNGIRYATEFYGRLSSSDEGFRAAAGREMNSMMSDLGTGAGNAVTLLGQIIAFSHDDPLSGDLRTYENSPALQQFSKDSAAVIDAGIKGAAAKYAEITRRAKTDPVGAAGELGDFIGTLMTTLGRDLLLTEVGAGAVSRFGSAIERSLPFARGTEKLTAATEGIDPAVAALEASVDPAGQIVVRQALEELGEGAILTTEQLEALGGFYAADAERVQQIIRDVNQKYGVNIEIQCRPGNPASLESYLDGTGVPKPEWVKPKNTEWMDRVLGAPQESLGKATVFKPIKPDAATLAPFSPAQQQIILARYDTQVKLFKDATEEGGKFFKILTDSRTEAGATYTKGFGAGAREVKGLRYSLRQVGEPGQEAYLVIDEAAGGKFVLSDADYQAVIDADTGLHLPAAKRGQIELEVMNRLNAETASFGGHGWSHSGFDLPAKFSETYLQFVTESSSPAAARRTMEWFVERPTRPDWLTELANDLALGLGRQATSAELIELLLSKFRPGSFVIKFNGTTIRTGYGAGIR